MTAPKFDTTGYALLDVGKGRAALSRYFHKAGEPIPVLVSGHLSSRWGGDDGISIEFGMVDAKLKEPVNVDEILKRLDATPSQIRLAAGEIDPDTMRTVRAVLKWVKAGA